MATQVYTIETLKLQDDTEVTIRPLNIKRLRQFMEIVENFSEIEKESDGLELMVKACAIAIAATDKELAEDQDRLEEILDVPTMYRILEVAGGVKMDGENLATAPARPGRI